MLKEENENEGNEENDNLYWSSIVGNDQVNEDVMDKTSRIHVMYLNKQKSMFEILEGTIPPLRQK